jgi:hypothetical protein
MADTAKAVINLATGFEDAERVTVASFVGGAAVERGAPSASAPASWTRGELVANAQLGGATPLGVDR